MTDGPQPNPREQYAAAIRVQAETGNVRYEAIADAVMAVRDRRVEELTAEVERMKVLVAASSEDGNAVRMAGQYADRAIANGERADRAEAVVAGLREWLPTLRRAVEQLPTECRYHDDTTPHGMWREACCDTGIPARRRELAEQALAALNPQERL